MSDSTKLFITLVVVVGYHFVILATILITIFVRPSIGSVMVSAFTVVGPFTVFTCTALIGLKRLKDVLDVLPEHKIFNDAEASHG